MVHIAGFTRDAQTRCGGHPGAPPPASPRSRTHPAAGFRLVFVAITLALTLPLAVVTILTSSAPAYALTTTSIALDGSFNDWAPALADAQNVVTDRVGLSDPDNPPQGDRDITQVAATWDSANLYFYFRRSSSGSRALQAITYLDLDADGIMENTDRVAYWGYNNDSFQPSKTGLAMYVPAFAGGDIMLGDGHTMPGYLGTSLSGSQSGIGAVSGIEFESSISWASLGIASGAPIDVQFSAGNNINLPSGVNDNAGAPWTSMRHEFTFAPDLAGGNAAGATVTYTHTMSNTGNMSDTFDLTSSSTSGWPRQVLVNGVAGSSVTLAAGQSATITLNLAIPPAAAAGSKDTESITARSRADTTVVHAVTDTTQVGAITLVADSSGSMASGQTIRYAHTLTNNTSQAATFSVSATSNNNWTTGVYAADGVTPRTDFRLAAGASTSLVVAVTVASGAAQGSQDVMTVRAAEIGAPTVTQSVRDVTTVRSGLVVSPNNASPAGAGGTVTYWHTVTNSWPTSRTFTVSAQSSLGWTVRVYDADGKTPLSSVAVGQNGGSHAICVRVTAPTGAAAGAVDVTTVLAQAGTASASATDRTTLANLATYTDGVYSIPNTRFKAGEIVYARAMGVGNFSAVRFRWIDPSGRVVFTSPQVPVDILGVAPSQYTLVPTDPVGTWQLQLLQGTVDTVIAQTAFVVEYKASITSLYATDATTIGSSVSVNASVSNEGSVGISGSRIRYLLWWDQDSDGALSTGDVYIDTSGNPQTYSGSGAVQTHLTQNVAVTAGASWSDSAWSVSSRDFPNTGTWRLSAWWETPDGAAIDQRTTTFFAVPALGWPLAGLTAIAGFALLYRRFRRSLPSDKA